MPPQSPDPVSPHRVCFGWPMRLLLTFLLAHVVGQSLLSLVPYKQWAQDLDLHVLPRRLPDPAARERLRAEADATNPDPVVERLMETFDSVWEYHKPWPSPEARKALAKRAAERRSGEEPPEWPWLEDAQDCGRYVLGWVGTRLLFQERLLGFDQSWPMFSPNAVKADDVTRFRLVYADGSERVVRSILDPEDLTRYEGLRLLQQKPMLYSLKVEKKDEETRRLGYCNLLAHRHPVNDSGSPLDKILLVCIEYKYPAPGEDIRASLAAQSGPPGWGETPPFFQYDVRSRTGIYLEK